MKKDLSATSEKLVPESASLVKVSPFFRAEQGEHLDPNKLASIMAQVQEKINEGFTREAVELCANTLQDYSNSIDTQAKLSYLISVSWEIEGRFEESLEILDPFGKEEIIDKIKPETLAVIYSQKASCLSNLGEFTMAIDLSNLALKIAEERELNHLLANIKLVFARIYREKTDYPVARNFAEKAMKSARETGDRNALAEAYRIIGTTYFQEGKSLKAIDFFQQAIKIGTQKSGQFILGKIFSDMSAAYSALSRPDDGIESLKKAIAIFEKTGQDFLLAISYNNLGNNLILSGDWKKAEEILNRSVDLALEIDHPHLAIIICSIGELNLLKEDFSEAERLFAHALSLAEEKKKVWQKFKLNIISPNVCLPEK